MTGDRDTLEPAGAGNRIARVVGGFVHPLTHSRYARGIQRRLRGQTRVATFRGERCRACGGGPVRIERITRTAGAEPRPIIRTHTCARCGHVAIPENTYDYRTFGAIEELPLRARVGTTERQGREYHMAAMAADILGRDGLDVLVFGAGRSLDNHHIAGIPGVRSVVIADLMRLRDDAEFIDSSQRPTRRFDLVIASEVVEHFLDPRAEFRHLFQFVERGGLLVCSTNIHDGGDIARLKYPFIRGHTSYYTAASLTELAQANNWYLDFRVPRVATGYGGPRKRYVLFTGSRAVQASIVNYFGSHMYAPSESAWANKELARQRRKELAAAQAAEVATSAADPEYEFDDDEAVAAGSKADADATKDDADATKAGADATTADAVSASVESPAETPAEVTRAG